MSVCTVVRAAVAAHQRSLERELQKTKRARREFSKVKDDASLRYLIELFDGWEGEKDVSVRAKGSLERVMKLATDRYKQVNNRSDVQARCSVSVIIARGFAIQLPRSVCGDLFDHYKKSKAK